MKNVAACRSGTVFRLGQGGHKILKMDELVTLFALALLMPKDDYKKVARENTVDCIVDTQAVADYFHVSISDAAYRGVDLGLLKAWQ